MSNFRVNTPYLQHSTPEYNAAHRKENSEYNAKYYQAHKEKWGVDSDSKSGKESAKSDSDDKKDKNKKKTGSSGKSMADVLKSLNGGSKAISKNSSKKSSEKSSSKEKKTDEEKEEEKRLKEEEKKKKEEEKEKEKALKERERKRKEEWAKKNRIEDKQKRKDAERLRRIKLKRSINNYHALVRGKSISGSLNHSSMDGNYLIHHGIDNQRWGVRHGPPYPLAREVANAVKKGAEKGLKEGRKNAINYAVQGTVRPVTDRIQKKKNPQKFDAKKLATGALVIAGSAIATGVITKLVDYGIDKSVDAGKKAVANVLMHAPHEGLSNVGVNMLLDAARSRS